MAKIILGMKTRDGAPTPVKKMKSAEAPSRNHRKVLVMKPMLTQEHRGKNRKRD